MAEQQPLSGAEFLSAIEEKVEVFEAGVVSREGLAYLDPERVITQLDRAFALVKTDADIPPHDEVNYSHPLTSINPDFDVVDNKKE